MGVLAARFVRGTSVRASSCVCFDAFDMTCPQPATWPGGSFTVVQGTRHVLVPARLEQSKESNPTKRSQPLHMSR